MGQFGWFHVRNFLFVALLCLECTKNTGANFLFPCYPHHSLFVFIVFLVYCQQVSPAAECYEESLQTLQYAERLQKLRSAATRAPGAPIRKLVNSRLIDKVGWLLLLTST